VSRLGSNYDAYARVPLCRACGNPFVPPGHGGCCSVRCTQYLEVARQPALGNSLYCQRDEPIKCWSCEVSFISRGIRYCPECWDRSRSIERKIALNANEAEVGGGVGVGLTQRGSPDPDCNSRSARHDAPINDRNPRSRCLW
jgi:hypothetical protein